jgi:hypothetical protein
MTACLFLGMQSLTDIAQEEAKRRQLLEQQGIEGKVVDGNALPSVAAENPAKAKAPSEKPKKDSSESSSSKKRASVQKYRAALQKLDRQIRQDEDRLALAQVRLKESRWTLPKSGRLLAGNRTADAEARLQKEIDEWQMKLKELRREREETYEEGRKAGFLPGELEGKT